jgi:membrane protein
VALDLRGRVDRVAERVPPLAYSLRVHDRYNDVHGNVVANSITLTAFLALFALTLLAVAAVGFLDRTNVEVAKEITEALGLSGDAAKVVTQAVGTARDSARFATMIGFIGVVTIGTSFTNAIGTAYNVAWAVRGRGLIDRARGLVWLVGIGVLFAASIVITDLWSDFPGFLEPALILVTVAINAVGWTFTSWWLPNRHIAFRAMLPAVVVGAVTLEVLKYVAAVWVPRLIANSSELWGTIGAVFALIAWILVFGRVIAYVAIVEVLEAERIGAKAPAGTNLLP